MPTNVTPQYREAEARYRAAKTTDEKLACLEEMLRIMPKHKGTDHLQADVKSRIAKLKQELKESKKHGGGHSHMVPREGAGQVALVGPPNSGKSSLLAALTHAEPRIAEFPFTTKEALPGMMACEDVSIQLVDLPAVSREHVEPWVFDLARRADLLWVVVENGGSLDGLELCRELLAAKHIHPVAPGSAPPETEDLAAVFPPALVVVTGMDGPGSEENLALLGELTEVPWPLVAVSARDGRGLDALRRRTFEALAVIRIYTKEPGKPPDKDRPYTLPRGATVLDLAATIHREIAEKLKFARVWGSAAFDGQQVQREHVLQDGDVVELHS
jgi:hypothetical protein